MNSKVKILNKEIIFCNKCIRLKDLEKKLLMKKENNLKMKIIGESLSLGFGDMSSEIVMVGLAPAAHGGNRTGRVFTGDKSADFLFKLLHSAKFSNNSKSTHLNDGLILKNIYLTVALKCVPPFDKPTAKELTECFKFFHRELSMLKKLKIVVALGRIAFDSCLKFFDVRKKDFKFYHGAKYKINNNLTLVASYHPSPRNVNTKRIDEKKMVALLESLK